MKACMQSKELHAMTDEERNKLQAHLRKMYLDIEKVCDAHGLRMTVGYGSVLGALRHQGFIPWDDDIDLLMPRADYDRLINEYAGELPENYKIYAPNSKNGPIYRFAKVVDTNTRFLTPSSINDEKHGIFVDIFPLENSSTNILTIKCKWFISCVLMLISSSVDEYQSKSMLYKEILCSTKEGKRTYRLRNLIGFLFSFWGSKTWYNLFDRFVKKQSQSNAFSIPSDGASIKHFYPIPESMFFPSKRMVFDDIEVYVPKETERYCELEYGDWKWVPPVDQRWQHFIKEIQF